MFAAHLSAVHDVVACVRRPFTEYRVESATIPFEGPATAATTVDEIPWDEPADAVFVGVKSHHTDGAAHWFERLCGPDTVVPVMQNGIEQRQRLAPYAGEATILPAVVYCGAELLAPGHIRHSARSQLIVEEGEPARRVEELCRNTPLKITPSQTYLEGTWTKLGVNSAANGLTALTGRPMAVLADPGIAAIAEQLLTECWTIGRRVGADLDLDKIPDLVATMGTSTEGRTSMLHDREAGRATEHDAIHGAVIRAGEANGIPTPVTRLVHDLLAAAPGNS